MKYVMTLLLALAMTTASAQSTAPRSIKVNGSAETEVTPDIIVLSVRLTEYEENKDLVSLETIDKAFLKAVKASGLEDDQIVVSRVSSNAYNTKRKRKAFASKTYELTFSDQKGLLNLTGRLKNADIDYMYITKLSHTKMADLRLEVKMQALKAAKLKAEKLLSVVDAELGDILHIDEASQQDGYNPLYRVSNMAFESAQAPDELSADDIGFKKIKLRYEIVAEFEIR